MLTPYNHALPQHTEWSPCEEGAPRLLFLAPQMKQEVVFKTRHPSSFPLRFTPPVPAPSSTVGGHQQEGNPEEASTLVASANSGYWLTSQTHFKQGSQAHRQTPPLRMAHGDRGVKIRQT